jgi:hypothetical protein
MTKQEIIKEAYGTHYDEVSSFIDENGWCVQIDYSTDKELKNHRSLNEIGFTQNDDLLDFGYFSNENKHKWRPKTLDGLEDNNGWRLIDELDVEENEYVLFLRMTEGGEVPIFTSPLSCDFSIGYFTHWKRIDISKPPLFDSN